MVIGSDPEFLNTRRLEKVVPFSTCTVSISKYTSRIDLSCPIPKENDRKTSTSKATNFRLNRVDMLRPVSTSVLKFKVFLTNTQIIGAGHFDDRYSQKIT